jgi:iron complex transport system ATP-binding protein
MAQRVAVVPQQLQMPFAFSVWEMVMLGRTPFVRALSDEGEADRRAVQRALLLTNTEELVNRTFNELSGGERQKVILAMALAQEPKLLLLDEPTVHLDVNHQIEILELIKALNLENGITTIAAMHDLNLAALYFDRLVLLKEGSIFADGSPAEVLTEETIRQVYSAPVLVRQHPSAGVPNITIIPRQKD